MRIKETYSFDEQDWRNAIKVLSHRAAKEAINSAFSAFNDYDAVTVNEECTEVAVEPVAFSWSNQEIAHHILWRQGQMRLYDITYLERVYVGEAKITSHPDPEKAGQTRNVYEHRVEAWREVTEAHGETGQ